MTETTAPQTDEATPCQCSAYDALPTDLTEEQIENGDFPIWETGCTATTRNTFAPGHDAKLKSFLIKHGAADHEIRRIEGAFRVSDDAIGHASRHGFGHMVAAGIAKAEGKAAARANKEQVRAERKAAKAKPLAQVVADEQQAHAAAEAAKVAEREANADWSDEEAAAQIADEDAVTEALTVTAKVGRWEYKGQLTEDGQFAYTDNKGKSKTAKKFTIV